MRWPAQPLSPAGILITEIPISATVSRVIIIQ